MADRETKQYWRSLDRLLDSPAIREQWAEAQSDERFSEEFPSEEFPSEEFPSEEFPSGASDPPDAVSRRTLMRLMGASFALAGTMGCRRPVEKIVPYVEAPEDLIPGRPETFATTMPFGNSAYGLVVESHEGRPTKVEGNELHPSSRGAATGWMQAAVLDLYDPDRSRVPRRRRAVESDSEEATWDEFRDFWQGLAAGLETRDGSGLAVVTEAYSSPTIARLITKLGERFPALRCFASEPVGQENVYRGLELATGLAQRPIYHFAAAQRILALDADFLATEPESVRHSRDFATGRRPAGPMSRLYVVESALSLTGAAADHRLRLASHRLPVLVAALAHELQRLGRVTFDLPGFSPDSLNTELATKVRLLAGDLVAASGAALIIVGHRQPPEVHALVHLINRDLGALGSTLTLGPLTDAAWGGPSALGDLVSAVDEGAVSTLLLLGGNPIHDAPPELEFAEALGKVDHSVHLSDRIDETSLASDWHLPRAHFLESWGDCRDAAGTASVTQPLIAPLHDGRSVVEVLGLLVHDEWGTGYGQVRSTWLGDALLGNEDFDSIWNRVLHDGLLTPEMLPQDEVEAEDDEAEDDAAGDDEAGDDEAGDDEDAAEENSVAAAPEVPSSSSVVTAFELVLAGVSAGSMEGLEIVFQPSAKVFDGRFANNGWLQELPDPVTKLTWGNAALLSPRTAREQGVETGDLARLELAGRAIETPILVLPGQADDCVAVDLGYGRSAAGRVGDGVGANAYRLRSVMRPYFDRGLQVTKIGRAELASTQEHGSMEGRRLVREATVDDYVAAPHFAADTQPEAPQLWPPHTYDSGYQWGMTIDLNACTGCNACVVACQSENNIPVVGKEQVSRGREMQWLRVDRYFSGDAEDPQLIFQPIPCMQCENAPCEQVCPVSATVHDSEGLNAMVYNRCIGTRYCSNNCPYKVRRFNFFNYTRELPELVQLAMNPDVTVRSRGVMEKCTYCVQRIHQGKRTAKLEDREVRDGEIKTACQQTCPVEAIAFGNLSDPQSQVNARKGDDRNYVLLGELNNRPRTSYLAKIRNPHPDWDTPT